MYGFEEQQDTLHPFSMRLNLGSVTFVRDAQGHVIGYTYHRNDGQEIHVKKIK